MIEITRTIYLIYLDYLPYLTLICMLLVMINFSLKVCNFIDVKRVLIDYFKIFAKSKFQVIILYICPIIFSSYIINNFEISDNVLNNVNIVITILTSMFFAVLGLLSSFDYSKKNSKFCTIVKETFNITLFEILCCIVCMVFTFMIFYIGSSKNTIVLNILYFFMNYFVIVILQNVLIIIKRIKFIFDKNVGEKNETKKSENK